MHPPLDGAEDRHSALKQDCMKRYDLTIPSDAPGGRLLTYVSRQLPMVPFFILRDAFVKKDVKVNGKRVGQTASVTPGAQITLFVRERESRKIPILYQDGQVLIAVKPAGISCEKDAQGGKTLTALLQDQLREQDSSAPEPLLCHRLDNPTEGLMVLALTPGAQASLQDAFRNRQIHKEYICLVRGTPSPAHQVASAWLQKDALHARVHIYGAERPGAKPIITEYTVLQPGPCCRLRVCLHTGRTHQIRAHMAFLGHPLLGDDQYGDRAFNREYKARKLMLCSSGLRFSLEGPMAYLNDHPFTIQPSF